MAPEGCRFLFRGETPSFWFTHETPRFSTAEVRKLLRDARVKVVRLPARSPNLNAYADRIVFSIKSECLKRIVPLGETHLREPVRQFTDHHLERPHQGLDGELIAGITEAEISADGQMRCYSRLGGMLNSYYRLAA